MSMKTKNIKVTTLPYAALALIMLCMVLTGCNLREPSKLADKRLQVEQETFSDTVAVADLNASAVRGLSNHYRKHGDGPLELTVMYDPKSRTGGAMKASDEAARLASEMRAQGVADVDVSVMPVKDSGEEMQALISYTAYNALAPKDCDVMPGMRDLSMGIEEDYGLGCTVETLFAKQVARPKDLKGQGSTVLTSDGRRASNSVELYRTGVPNEPLEGENASE